jgi:hypothetical protein
MSDKRMKSARVLVLLGLAAMVVGVLDPLEGSVVILAGLALVTVGAAIAGSRHSRLLYASLGMVVVGVGALWGLSAVGGFGGTSGRSWWWGLLILPYPVGWITGLVGATKKVREGFRPA